MLRRAAVEHNGKEIQVRLKRKFTNSRGVRWYMEPVNPKDCTSLTLRLSETCLRPPTISGGDMVIMRGAFYYVLALQGHKLKLGEVGSTRTMYTDIGNVRMVSMDEELLCVATYEDQAAIEQHLLSWHLDTIDTLLRVNPKLRERTAYKLINDAWPDTVAKKIVTAALANCESSVVTPKS